MSCSGEFLLEIEEALQHDVDETKRNQEQDRQVEFNGKTKIDAHGIAERRAETHDRIGVDENNAR